MSFFAMYVADFLNIIPLSLTPSMEKLGAKILETGSAREDSGIPLCPKKISQNTQDSFKYTQN